MKTKWLSVLVCFFWVWSNPIFAQVSDEDVNIYNTSKREEIQRYAGFEDLPIMYLTLPTDNFFGVNMDRSFMDIGFIILLVLPLLLVWKSTQIKGLQIGLGLFIFTFIFILSLPSAFYNYHDLSLGMLSEFLENYTFQNKTGRYIPEKIVHSFMSLTGPIYEKIIYWIRSWDTPYSIWTYPFLVCFFILLLSLIALLLNKKSREIKFLGIAFLLSGFLWILFSAGITWYGLALFPLAIILIFHGWGTLEKWKKSFLLFFVLIQLGLHFPYRYTRYNDTDRKGGVLFESAVSAYQTNQLSKAEYVFLLTDIPEELLNYINRDLSSKIYRSGTNLHFFILRNDKRVFQDNQFGQLQYFIKRKNGKNEFRRFLKTKGFKFVILDLAMGTIDITPEKSLETKQEEAIELFRGMKGMRLLYTDRVILDSNSGMSKQGLGDRNSKKIRNGKMAIFEVL